jgi:hypothetical protein
LEGEAMRVAATLFGGAAIFLATSQIVVAAGPNAKFTVLGVGNSSCGSWLAVRRTQSSEAQFYETWVQGYITGYNRWNAIGINNIASGIDPEGIFASIDKYCIAHPLDDIEDGARDTLFDLLERLTQALERENQSNPILHPTPPQ